MPDLPIMTGKCALVYLAKKLIAEGRGKPSEFAAELKRLGIELDDASHKAVWDRVTKKWMKEKTPQEQAVEDAISAQEKFISEAERSTHGEFLLGAWKAGYLSTLRAFQGSAIGNFFQNKAEDLARIPASMIDSVLALRSGERTQTTAGWVEGQKAHWSWDTAKAIWNTLAHGASEDDLLKFMEDHKKIQWQPWHSENPWLNAPAALVGKPLSFYVNKVFDVVSAADVPARRENFARGMVAHAVLVAKNEGLKGQAFKDRVQQLIVSPPDDVVVAGVIKAALAETDEAVLASQATNAVMKAGQAAAHSLGAIIMPFAKVPINQIARNVEWSPIGIAYGGGKTLQFLFSGDVKHQRQAVNALSRGTTGTAALLPIGYLLAQAGILNPPEYLDEGKRGTEEAAGYKPGAINLPAIGQQYQTVDMPFAWPMLIGAAMYWREQDALAQGLDKPQPMDNMVKSSLLTTIAQGLNIPTLRGVKDSVESLRDIAERTDRPGAVSGDEFANSRVTGNIAGGVNPGGVTDIKKWNDPLQRSALGPKERLSDETPFMEPAAPRTDALGKPSARNAGFGSQARNFSPIEQEKRNDVVAQELRRLRVPLSAAKRLADKANPAADRSGADWQERIGTVGRAIHTRLEALIRSEGYAKLSDAIKRERLMERIDEAKSEAASDFNDRRGTDPLRRALANAETKARRR